MKSTKKKIVRRSKPATSDSIDTEAPLGEELSVNLPPVNTTRSNRGSRSFPHASIASPVRSPTGASQRSAPRSPMASPRDVGTVSPRSPRDLHRTNSNMIVGKYFSADVRDRLNDAGLLAEVERVANDWQRELQTKETSVDSVFKDNKKLRNSLQDGQHDHTLSLVETSKLDKELKVLRTTNDQLRADQAIMEKTVLEEGASYQGRLQLADQKASEAMKRLTETQLDLKACTEAHQSLRGQFDTNRSQLIEALQQNSELLQKARDEEQEVVRLQTELSSCQLKLAEAEGGDAGMTCAQGKDDSRMVEKERDGAMSMLQQMVEMRLQSRTSYKVAQLREELRKTQGSLVQIVDMKHGSDFFAPNRYVDKIVGSDSHVNPRDSFSIEVTK